MFSKKSCLTCVFCLHCRDSFYGFPKPEWDYKKDNLTEEEILQLEKGNISFLSEPQRKRKEWIETYEQKEEERNKKLAELNSEIENSVLGKIVGKDGVDLMTSIAFRKPALPIFEDSPYPYREEFGMEPCPSAPNYEYLECWKEIWGEKNEDIWTTLKSKKCANYYPLSKKATKTLKACDEERKDKADNRKYWRGVIVGFISAFIVMLMRFLIAPYFTSTNNEVDNYPTQLEQEESREIQPTNEENDNNSNISAEQNTNQDINKKETNVNNVKHRISESEE